MFFNLEKDLEDIQSTARSVAGAKKRKQQDFGSSWRVTNSKHGSLEFQSKMEGIVYLVVEWISLREMKALQSACMLVSIQEREKRV